LIIRGILNAALRAATCKEKRKNERASFLARPSGFNARSAIRTLSLFLVSSFFLSFSTSVVVALERAGRVRAKERESGWMWRFAIAIAAVCRKSCQLLQRIDKLI
jgi:hypothetical protein